MATLTLALDGQKGLGISPWLAGWWPSASPPCCSICGTPAATPGAVQPEPVSQPHLLLGLGGSFAGRIGSGMLPFMTPVFLQIGLGFSPFHAGLMMIPMVLGSMGMKRIVVQVVNRFGYRRVLVAARWAWRWSACCLWPCPDGLVLRAAAGAVSAGDDQLQPLLLDEYPDAERSAGRSGQQRQQPAVDGHAAVDEYRRDHRRAAARLYGQQHISVDAASTHQVFLYTYLSMAVIIALPALIFSRVPDDTSSNTVIRRRKRSGS
jgi:DHA2 family multidrug resistance protein-like MFS transporter